MPRVTVATKPTGTEASACARSRSDSIAAGVSTGGIGVRHPDDPAVAACGGGAAARLDVLLVLAAWGAEVDVRVEEGGDREEAVRRR